MYKPETGHPLKTDFASQLFGSAYKLFVKMKLSAHLAKIWLIFWTLCNSPEEAMT